MSENESFNQKVIQAALEKEQWFNSVQFPKVLEAYRLHLACVGNIYDGLTRRSLIMPDPYKEDNKVTEIKLPDSDQFLDSERGTIIGLRLSQYISILDYICNYLRFSVNQITLEKIKKLVAFNSAFEWRNLSQNSPKCNTRCLAMLVNDLKAGESPIAQGLLKDALGKCRETIEFINETLKDLQAFHNECYKVEIRKKILNDPQFRTQTAYSSPQEFLAEIKRLFPTAIGKKAIIAELAMEIANEETAPNKEQLQEKLLAKLGIEKEKTQKEKSQIDSHELLMEAVRLVGSTSDQYSAILRKITANHEVLESEKQSFANKFMKLIRSIFGMEDPPVIYELTIVDKKTSSKKKLPLNYSDFVLNLSKRIRNYANFSTPESPGYEKIKQQPDSILLDYLNKQMAENTNNFSLLIAMDDYFKTNVDPTERSKVKGLSMELTTIKNILVKSNQLRAEYMSCVEEQKQMERLGVT